MRHIAFCTAILAFAFATQAAALDQAKDYVSGTEIAVDANTLHAEANGVTFWFASEENLKAFQADTAKYLAVASEDHCWWVQHAMSHYFEIRKTLSTDSVEGILPHAKAISEYAAVAAKLEPKFDAPVLAAYHEQLDGIVTHSTFPEQPTLETARLAFKNLSTHVILFVRKVASKQKETPAVFLFHCGMAQACWAQEIEEPGNPYFGQSMLKCGDSVSTDESVPFDGEKKCEPGSGCHGEEKGGEKEEGGC